jgi:hypothetical protein
VIAKPRDFKPPQNKEKQKLHATLPRVEYLLFYLQKKHLAIKPFLFFKNVFFFLPFLERFTTTG